MMKMKVNWIAVLLIFVLVLLVGGTVYAVDFVLNKTFDAHVTDITTLQQPVQLYADPERTIVAPDNIYYNHLFVGQAAQVTFYFDGTLVNPSTINIASTFPENLGIYNFELGVELANHSIPLNIFLLPIAESSAPIDAQLTVTGLAP